MIRLTQRPWAWLLSAAGLLLGGAVSAQPPASRIDPAALKESKPIELVFLRDHGPLLVKIHVVQGGSPIHVAWQKYVERWFDFLDYNRDGSLDDTALAGAPNAAAMRNLASQGGFFPNRGLSLTLRDLGKSSGEKASRAEFVEYYRKNNVGAVQTGFAPPEPATGANIELFKRLDADNDGKLSRAEIEAAGSILARLDTDDDELVSLRELSPLVSQPAGRGFVVPLQQGTPAPSFQGTSFFHLTSESTRTGLATLMLARYDKKKRMTLTQKEIGLDDAAFKRLDENKNGSLDLIELAKFPLNASAVQIVVNLRPSGGVPAVETYQSGPLTSKSVRLNGGTLTIDLGDSEIAIQNFDAGGRGGVAFNQFGFIAQQLKAADTKNRGYVELKDLDGPQNQFLRTLFPTLDRNNDGKVTDKEAKDYFDLQGQARDVSTSFYVQEQGRNWFQLLDANRDGQLSPRELMTAWQRLAPYAKNDAIDANNLPMQFRVAFNPAGNQQFVVANADGRFGPMAAPARFQYPGHAPLWFRKMDRNGDGDVSRREFLGAAEDFDRLDTNRDGLLDVDEAAAAAKR